MKKAFEKFRQAQQYIAEKNYNAMTDMLTQINNSFRNNLQFGFHYFSNENRFEKTTDYMIANEIIYMILTELDFSYDDNFIQLCTDTHNNIISSDDNYLPFNYNYFTMNRIKKELRVHTIKLFLKKLQTTFNASSAISSYMEKLVWYTAFEGDDELLEEIYNLTNNEVAFLDPNGTCLCSWMWMYLQVIIDRNRYDLLDKTIKLIYEKNNYDFTEIGNCTFTTMTYSEFIFLLYRRYVPETSDSQIIEKLLDSSYFRMFRNNSNNIIVKNELEYLSKLRFKTRNANFIFELWLLSERKYKKEYLYSLMEENPILFINNDWIDPCSEKECFDFLKEMLIDNPDITVSFDPKYMFMNLNITQLKKVFSIRKPILTGRIKDNQCIIFLIKTKSKKLKTLLESIKIDDKTRDDLIEICIQYKNIPALNIISNYSKE